MLSRFLGFLRPAALGRRSLFAVFSWLVVGLLSPGCGGFPEPDVDGARTAAQRAIRMARPSSPRQARYIERLVADAEVATAGELSAPWWRATPGRAQAAWLRVMLAAREATSGIRARQAAAQQRFEVLLPTVREEISRAQQEISETGMGRREAAAMQRATTVFTTALRFAEADEHGRAADRLGEARELVQVVHKAWLSLHERFRDPALRRTWQRWAETTIRESRREGTPAIVVDKLRRRLDYYDAGVRVATLVAELGVNGLRPKEHSGDRATPEGLYRVSDLKEGRRTNFYKALLIDYPNEEDIARFTVAKQRGRIPRRAGIGSLIEIHGEGGEGRDWTDGCVALTNENMDWLYDRVTVGTPVTIVGRYEHRR